MHGRLLEAELACEYYSVLLMLTYKVLMRCHRHANIHSTCSGDSLMGVMGLEERRCFSLLRLRCVLGFLGA